MADVINEVQTQAPKGESLVNQLMPPPNSFEANPPGGALRASERPMIPSGEANHLSAGKVILPSDGTLDIPELRTPGWDAGDNLSSSQEKMYESAKESVGQKMWDFGPNARATQDGRLGGATSAAHIADLAGFKGLDSASVVGLAKELGEKYQFHQKPLSLGKPGDFMIDPERHRIGIIGKDGKMFAMNRESVWTEMPLTKSPTARALSQN